MSTWQLSLLIKPLALLAFFLMVAVIARGILRLIPDGKVKRLLSRRIN